MQTEMTSSARAVQCNVLGLGAAVSTAGHTVSESMQIEEAQARQFCALEQSALQIAAFQHHNLVCGHLSSIGPQLAIQIRTDGIQLFIGLEGPKCGHNLVFNRRQAPFEIFEIGETLCCLSS